jgi:hypothetical protein
MLKTETNTGKMEKRIRAAASKRFGKRSGVNTNFEHGQWWVTLVSGAQYSVVDAEGGPAIDGFDFEQVTEADED